MDLVSTLSGSMMEGFFPAGWDLHKIDQLAAAPPAQLHERRICGGGDDESGTAGSTRQVIQRQSGFHARQET